MIHRHIDKARIAKEMFPIRQREVQAFHDPMDVVGGVVRQPVDAHPFHQRQRLLQRGALTPRAAGDQFVAAPGPPPDRFDAG